MTLKNALTPLSKLAVASVLGGWLLAGQVAAENYYRWTDETGVVHYGSTPPKGVEAVKVKTWGGGSKTGDSATEQTASNEAENSAAPAAPPSPEEKERQRKVAERQQEVCKQEQQRLEVLKRPGRIRMKQPDGSFRYMTQDEIQQEINTTQKVIGDSCK